MSDREAMKEALRLLTKCAGVSRLWQVTDACDILRARLAAPEPEPVAKACWACHGKGFLRDIDTAGLLPCVVCKPQEDKT